MNMLVHLYLSLVDTLVNDNERYNVSCVKKC